jgi:hypothetical protein
MYRRKRFDHGILIELQISTFIYGKRKRLTEKGQEEAKGRKEEIVLRYRLAQYLCGPVVFMAYMVLLSSYSLSKKFYGNKRTLHLLRRLSRSF